MQFRHPELFYGLFLLIIPILVHLFQLRKFKKEAFTNVAFLKKINLQTRKSNVIKKWLILGTRMAAIAMIVLAFSHPFLPASDSATKKKETVIYLDNSFSMQAKGSAGPLLKQSIQDLIKNIPEETPFTLLTNDEVYKATSLKEIRQELLTLPYTANQLSFETVALRAQKEFSEDPTTERRLVVISDFQDKGQDVLAASGDYITYAVQLTPETTNNVSLDSIFVSDKQTNTMTLTAALSTATTQENNVPVSLYNGENLIAKGTAAFDETTETTVNFDIQPAGIFEGKLVIEDPYLGFDNTLFFSLNSGLAAKVLSINEADDRFLARIFRQPDFDYQSVRFRNLDYSIINDQNLVILNEAEVIPAALVNALSAFAKAGGSIIIIPNTTTTLVDYNTALTSLSKMQFKNVSTNERLVTTINYDHPLYENVFENRIKNFQYPKTTKSYNLTGGDRLLAYDDGAAFLATRGNTYVFSSPLNDEVSNFKNSPLIVPTLYNIGKESLSVPQLYTIAQRNAVFDIPVSLENDAIVSISDITAPEESFIPLQQSFATKVRVTTDEDPKKAGIYAVQYKDSIIQQLSYNYDRSESVLRYQKPAAQEGITYSTSVVSLFDSLKASDDVRSLWKWFVIFALGFLLLEMLILKFFK